MVSRRALLVAFSSAALALGLGAARSAALAEESIVLGLASPGPLADPIYEAVAEAKDQGLNVKVIEFTDWVTPNVAVASGDIQHIPFLNDANAAKGTNLVSIGVGTSSKLGLYSKKYKSFAEIPDGATVAIANDPVNSGRGLVLLERAGLIKLKPGLDYKATELDITDNPKHLKIVEVVAQQLPRALDDVDLAEGYAHLLKAFGVDPHSALLFDPIQDHYALQFVVKPGSPKIEQVKKFVHIYQTSPKVRAILAEKFGDLIVPAW
ncbi:MAG TPA: MetQ/NlpA family ABC transporter substrate-binding protein [Roseiarcus sp.]|jgi:D-methionine transport system substrate-binding protein